MTHWLKKLCRDIRGTMAIETAIVAPVLILMTLGIFEVGTIVARQHELQSAANEAEIIILATNQGATVEINTMKLIIADSVDVAADKITVEREFRCSTNSGKTKDKGNCTENTTISTYVVVGIQDRYTPTWTAFGIGQPLDLSISRSVQVS
jgi:Flp pilus assembly protein TadG